MVQAAGNWRAPRTGGFRRSTPTLPPRASRCRSRLIQRGRFPLKASPLESVVLGETIRQRTGAQSTPLSRHRLWAVTEHQSWVKTTSGLDSFASQVQGTRCSDQGRKRLHHSPVGTEGQHGLRIAPSATYPSGSGMGRSKTCDQENEWSQYGFTVNASFVLVDKSTQVTVL